ncbi:hypothetical protein P872_23510 [Rhodonellum psychrophilum GCM71 = DSM 17998]|uniref:Uncharacterized protein n=1 Tax=Rhodonellum psychrophilum GCM71 = DSM 17998 TaxID=1123057 RepID=U5BVK2_9BACT|nr:hypothetical protein P872_23510 [Rhodonellum psychrophilum GCM71 = DSM 17998]
MINENPTKNQKTSQQGGFLVLISSVFAFLG